MRDGGSHRKISDVNPVVAKALNGDKSDNIVGYKGIGPVKSEKLASSLALLDDFVDINDRRKYFKNTLLIDMSLHPKLMVSCAYVQKKLAKKPEIDKDKMLEAVEENRITGMRTDINRLFFALDSVVKKEYPCEE